VFCRGLGAATDSENVGGVLSFGFPAETQVFVPGSHVPPLTQSALVLHDRVGSKQAPTSSPAQTTVIPEIAVRIVGLLRNAPP
jgi:hypothetical protein